MINPDEVPVPQVDCDAVETAGENLKSDGTDVSQAGQDIKSSWKGLEGIYAAPEAETLFAAIDPVATKGDDFDGVVTKVGTALITFAGEVRPIKARLKALKADAESFVSDVEGDDDWREDEDKVNEHNDLNNDILQAVFEYQSAERDCANAITSLFGGTTFVAQEPGGETDLGPNEEAHGTTEALKGIETPWATPQEYDAPWYEDAWNGVKDFGVGFAEDLGSLVGLYGEDGWGVGSWSEWGSNLKNNWGDTLAGLGSLVGLYGENGWGVSSWGEWGSNLGNGWTEFAHAIVPWREWGDRPGYVITQTICNVGSMFVGGAGVVKALAKGARKVGGNGDVDVDANRPDADVDLQDASRLGDNPGQTTQGLQNQLDDLDIDQQQLDGIQDSLDEAEGFETQPTPVGGGDPIDAGDNTPSGGGNGNSDGVPDGDSTPDGDGHTAPDGDGVPDGDGDPTPEDGATSDPAESASPDNLTSLSPEQRIDRAEALVSDGARTFSNNAEASRYGRGYWNDYVENLPYEQRAAITDYTRDKPHYPTYREINGQLRQGGPFDPAVEHDIENIDKALAGRPIPEDVVISRGTGLGHLSVEPQNMRNDPDGFTDPGYLSTSLGRPGGVFGWKEAVLHLRVPAGTPALWVEKAAAGGAERELLLGRGVTYRVHDAIRSGGQWQIYGEVVPPG
ncbi:ADP-ribosyltransferase [Streptomonospora wellingtoniae]|uniref:ADP-ribosyltransferase n=1 Tax=Streptomonospora wellingtoniae TaxID=3075544 RepID=A0ABU2KY52_9ACTN|nr:ADP-ribosyltransferase [Streptomonospora sp. DSM 45055]MDT0304225.1 ADP-ribosyltransferase [Streptomonospora sp. DSM 45055]